MVVNVVRAGLKTNPGLVRERNEDFIAAWEPQSADELAEYGVLYVVADGVGGADAGDIASQQATESAIRHYLEGDGESAERLLKAIQNANVDLRNLTDERGNGRYMATTLVAALFRPQRVYLINVGDSRGYHIRQGKIRQVTRDMSLVAQLVEEGAITPEEAAHHPRRNVILSSLGPLREPQIDVFNVALERGDTILLCSDGLIRHVEDAEIAEIVSSQDPDEAAEILIDLANARGGSDNITVAVLHYEGETHGDSPSPTAVRAWVVPLMSKNLAIRQADKGEGWRATLILSMIEAILIVLVWYLLRV